MAVTNTPKDSRRRGSAGFTLLELLMALMLSGFVFAGLMRQYSNSVSLSHDNAVRISAILQAQATLQTIGSELRMLGNGVPFEQANFQIGNIILVDPSVAEPLVLGNTDVHRIGFRLNETGDSFLLTQDFNPTVDLTVHLTDTSNLDVNDPIYISNSVMSGDDGLYGTIAAVNHSSKTITLNNFYVNSPDSTFVMGSVLEEVPIITYNSPTDGSGITRDSGFGPVLMAPHSTMTLTFLEPSGAQVALPLTDQSVVSQLRAIHVKVEQTSANKLSDGSNYTAVAEQTFGIRNLNYLF